MSIKQPFEKVVEEHGRTVLRVCRALLVSHDADDAWSETFLSAMRGYPELPETANVEAWLVTIAHRKAIDVLRSRKRQPVPVEEVTEAPTSLGVPDADETARRGRQQERADRGVDCPVGDVEQALFLGRLLELAVQARERVGVGVGVGGRREEILWAVHDGPPPG